MQRKKAVLLAVGASFVVAGAMFVWLILASTGFCNPLECYSLPLYLPALALVAVFPVGLAVYGLVLISRAADTVGTNRDDDH